MLGKVLLTSGTLTRGANWDALLTSSASKTPSATASPHARAAPIRATAVLVEHMRGQVTNAARWHDCVGDRKLADRRLTITRVLRYARRLPVFAEVVGAYALLWPTLLRRDLRVSLRRARARPGPRTSLSRADAVDSAQRIGGLVLRSASLLPVDRRCLIRSLVTIRMLSRRGIDARLAIGVDDRDGFVAHAWVELDGQPVLPTYGYHRLTEL